MPFIIRNISRRTQKTPFKVDIHYKDTFGDRTVHNYLEPDDFLIMYYKPTSAMQLMHKNVVSIEDITEHQVLELRKQKAQQDAQNAAHAAQHAVPVVQPSAQPVVEEQSEPETVNQKQKKKGTDE